ncbi:MAG: DUF882 domain-containing protein [Alphaproteobacteria bacterium]|nr:DUF882 domain-containing protein [Alphaproteobacteria bacterium]MCB9928853.1 DUF882 domain-containing protein [Alphaproteobacteria bacterium]
MADTPSLISRRAVLGGVLAAPFIIRPAEAAGRARALAMKHLHTEESIVATYWRNGRYDRGAWAELNHFLRDWRTDAVKRIDLKTLDIIHGVCERMRTMGPVEIIGGYRSPQTNAMLRHTSSGVAKKSYHMKGQAVDFHLPRQDIRETYRTALAMNSGGVGLYTHSKFVHVDTGPVRTWGR